ncbi:MAG: hypothetical protein ACXVB9_06580 [Bdellovibrionota bacterium]
MERRSLFLLSFLLPVGFFLPLGLRALLEPGNVAGLPAAMTLHRSVPTMPRRTSSLPPRSQEQGITPRWSAAEEKHLLELVSRNATCPLLQSRLANHAPITFLFHLLSLSPSRHAGPIPPDALEAYVHAISSRNEADFRNALRASTHPLARLTEAEALLGLLGKNIPVTPAPEAALPILRALQTELPGNALPGLLLAYGLHSLGDPSFSGEIAAALERPEFHTYGEEVLQSIYGYSLDQSVLLPAALGIAEQAPLLDLLPIEDLVLDRLVDEDRSFAESALGFGRRLLRFEASRSERQEFLFWSALNYTIGQRIARGSWKKLHPELAYPLELGVPRAELVARGVSLGKISDRHFSQSPPDESSLALCEEAIPRFAQGLKREWNLASSGPSASTQQ